MTNTMYAACSKTHQTRARLVMIIFLVSLLIPYMIYYSNRNIITAAIPYFVDHGVLTQKTFALMQTCSYGTMIVAKFGIGVLLTEMSHRLSYRTVVFGGLISLIGLSLMAVSTCTMFGLQEQNLAIAFIICFAAIKLISSVIRPLLLSIIHIGITNSVHGSQSSKRPARFMGWMSSGLQCLSCIGDVLGKITFSGLITDDQFIRWAQRCRQPSWTLAFVTLGSMSLISAFLPLIGLNAVAIKTNGGQSVENAPGVVENISNWRTLLKTLFLDMRFLLLLVCNVFSGFCSVASGSYAVHFYRFALGFDSVYVTKLDSISPVCIALGIMILTFLIQRFFPTARKMLCLLIIVAVADAILLRILKTMLCSNSFPFLSTNTKAIVALFIGHQALYFSFAAILDGLAVTYLLPDACIAPSTGIVSAFSYLGGFTAPFILYRWVSTLSGWEVIFGTVSWLLLANVILLTIISIILHNKTH